MDAKYGRRVYQNEGRRRIPSAAAQGLPSYFGLSSSASIRIRMASPIAPSRVRRLPRALWGCAALIGASLGAQNPEPPAAPRLPFAVGERLEYQGKYTWISLGTAVATIEALDTVRGHEVFRVGFTIKAGKLGINVNDLYTSWFDSHTLSSYRYEQHIHDPGYSADRNYEIFPDRALYVLKGDTSASVSNPLDDGSFIYFIRTIPLEIGQTYKFNQYFMADRNPVILKVERRDTIDVPAGRFACIVIRPTIISKGLFSEGGHAEVWVTDDDRRIIVQMRSSLKIGSLNMYLKSIEIPKPKQGVPGP
jgi:hypothetical protein